jgi:hypothetical protein
MKIIAKIIIFLFLFAMLASCKGFASTPAANPTDVIATETVIPASTPSVTPELGLATPTYFSEPTSVFTPAPDQQVYTDPNGWYSAFFPADMKLTDKPNTFSREGDFFETGYLTEMGYMSNVINVCAWLANIELEPEQSVVEWGSMLSPTFESEPRCAVSTNVNAGESIKYEIFENPAADPEHRFVYVKTSWSSFSALNGNIPRASFVWLKPITPRQEPTLPPLSNAEAALWEKTAPLLQDVSVTEYTLPPGSDPSQHELLIRELPEEAWPGWYRSTPDALTQHREPTVEEQLKTLGYNLIQTESGWKRLFRDGKPLFEDVINVSTVYTFSTDSGPVNTFIVNTKGTGGNYQTSFLIQNDAVYTWEYNGQDPPLPPILHQNEVLWLKATKDFDHVQILKNDQQVVFSFAVYTEPIYSVSRFATWNDHWVLAARDFLIQDGEFINEKFGFEEIFSWGLIAEKPVYLFRKGPRIGVSYDEKILPLQYQDVARYKCCGFAVNNPAIDSKGIHFFAKRDGVWYYVVVKVE